MYFGYMFLHSIAIATYDDLPLMKQYNYYLKYSMQNAHCHNIYYITYIIAIV